MDDQNCVTDDDFLRDLRDYTSALEPFPAGSVDHIAVGGLSDNPSVAELLERISEITRRDTRRRSYRTTARRGYARGKAYRWSFTGGRSRTAGATRVAHGNLPGNTTGWITAASTAGAFTSRSDACSYACWHCIKIICEA